MKAVDGDGEAMVESLVSMLRIRAVGPESGGDGEEARAKYLVGLLTKMGFEDIAVYESEDPRVPSGKRPNIVVRVPGTGTGNLWVVTHMDTVPEGDLGAWKHPPYEPVVEGGRIYGRGSEDNGQELIASLYGLHALMKAGIRPEMNTGLVFVSDEEFGNTHGIDFLLEKGLFRKGDFAIAPDHGEPNGDAVIVVEKANAWVRVEVVGRQTHASTPQKGVNAFEVAARFICDAVDRLRTKFSASDDLYDVPVSTFEPTRCEANGPNVNTVPGRQVFAFDFRILPTYPLAEVMAELNAAAKGQEARSGAVINISYIERSDAAPKTNPDSEGVARLMRAIEVVRGVRPKVRGMGGGTCAAPFRRKGIDAAVWSTIPGTAHDANEYARVEDLISDAKVYAVLFAGANISDAQRS